jgi:NADH-quinone oxidoreductase subunit E/NADP-reducing hydrogenase subunit HndA
MKGQVNMAKLSEKAALMIAEICDRYRDEKTPLMMILSDIQNEYGYIPLEVQEIVSRQTGISVAEIYGVVTFYSFFSLTPKGKYVIGCCLGTACYVKGSDKVLEAVEQKLGIKSGECTPDKKFSIDSCRCVGACGRAPVMMIDEDVYGKLTAKEVGKIIDSYYSKEGADK